MTGDVNDEWIMEYNAHFELVRVNLSGSCKAHIKRTIRFSYDVKNFVHKLPDYIRIYMMIGQRQQMNAKYTKKKKCRSKMGEKK